MTGGDGSSRQALVHEPSQEAVQEGRVRHYLKLLGPGLVTGAADDDPSWVATYAQAGATFTNGMLWTAPVTLPMMAGVQDICDRTALATGESLGHWSGGSSAGSHGSSSASSWWPCW